MQKNLTVVLQHMLESAQKVARYIDGHNKGSFVADEKLHQAVALNLLLIGEQSAAAIEIDEAFTRRHTQIDWLKLRNMRNQIAHSYFSINISTIWNVAKVEVAMTEMALPPLIEASVKN